MDFELNLEILCHGLDAQNQGVRQVRRSGFKPTFDPYSVAHFSLPVSYRPLCFTTLIIPNWEGLSIEKLEIIFLETKQALAVLVQALAGCGFSASWDCN